MTASVLPPRPDESELGPIGRGLQIVPNDGGAGWTLVAVIAALAFLAALAAGAAVQVASAAATWREAISHEATIQVKPDPGRDGEADLARAAELARETPGIRTARILSRDDAERLLEPWLGAGLDLSDLPVPRLIALELARDPKPDLSRLALRLKIDVPGSSLDDHSAWLSRLAAVTAGIVGFAISAVILVLGASAGAIGFATRGAVTGHRDVVEVLRLVGARDGFVAWLFAKRFARLGLLGGLIGSAAAAAALLGLALLSDNGASGGTGLIAALAPSPWTFAAMAAIAVADAAVAGAVAWTAVKRFLKVHR
ncbi:cell division protein FtsX [Enterovirga rhinocerotis]|uniref:Cell division transport system permease protein n=1 Tax=Enterovirga rhinocerotis TaxID=1339210 RepID=A0A4R7BTL7_9HYPH|nr:FtsX-like permease family protein [Enterovirga rhinocerotis]TDR89070.1 cell division transport system permease protein [Enterovirga rhinocerotis]